MPARSALARFPSLVALPTGLLTCPTALLLALLGFLRGALALWSLGLALRLGCLLLALRRPLLWLLPRRLACRATLLSRCLGVGGPLHLSAALLLQLPAWGRCSALLRMRRGGGGPLHLSASRLRRLSAWGRRSASLG